MRYWTAFPFSKMYTVSSVVPAGDEEIPAEDAEAEELLAAGLEEAADEFPNEDAGAEDSGIGMVLTAGSVAAEESGLPAAEDRILSVSAAEETESADDCSEDGNFEDRSRSDDGKGMTLSPN